MPKTGIKVACRVRLAHKQPAWKCPSPIFLLACYLLTTFVSPGSISPYCCILRLGGRLSGNTAANMFFNAEYANGEKHNPMFKC